MFVRQDLNKTNSERAKKDYLDFLNLSSDLQAQYESASNELNRNRSIGVASIPPKYTDSATELKDVVYQRELAFSKLKTMMKPTDASSVLIRLMETDDITTFNRFFNGFEKAVGYQQSITPELFQDLWDKYKIKLSKTDLTGIEIGVTQDDVDASLEELQNNIEALSTTLVDNQKINVNELQSIKERSEELVNASDFNALTELLNELAVLETGAEKEAAIKKAKEEADERKRIREEKAKLKKEKEEIEKKDRGEIESNMKKDIAELVKYPLDELRRLVEDELKAGQSGSYMNSLGNIKEIGDRSIGSSLIDFLIYSKYNAKPISNKYKATKVSTPKKVKSREPTQKELDELIKKGVDEAVKKGDGFKNWKAFKGRGIDVSPIRISMESENKKQGLSRSPKFMELGLYKIDIDNLHKGYLALKYKKNSRNVKNRILISDNLKKIFFQLLLENEADANYLKKLNTDEVKLLDDVLSMCRIDLDIQNKINKNLKTMSSLRDKDIARFNLLRGELLAGNDNKDLIKELKTLLLKMTKNGHITQSECNKILYEILALN